MYYSQLANGYVSVHEFNIHTNTSRLLFEYADNTHTKLALLNGSILFFDAGLYAMKVMTSFGYEIMLTRGCWFQVETLDVNKPWRQIPADRLLFWCSHIFFSDYPKAIRRGEISFKSNHVNKRNFEAANSRVSMVRGTSSGKL